MDPRTARQLLDPTNVPPEAAPTAPPANASTDSLTPALAPLPSNLARNAPATAFALRDTFRRLAGALTLPSGEAEYLRANVEGGVPIDRTQGIDMMEYYATTINRLKGDQFEYLKRVYGDKNVRVDTQGEFLVRIPDNRTGKLKDVPLKPEGLSAYDFLDLLKQTPEIALGIAGAAMGGGGQRGLLNALKSIGGMAAGAEVGGFAKDVAARTGQDAELKVGEAAGTRARMMFEDAMAGMILGAGGKVLSKIATPFYQGPEPITVDFRAAQAHWAAKGLDLPMTAGERTGSPLLMRIEAFATPQPGAASVFGAILKERAKTVQRIQDILQGKAGGAPVKTFEQVGEEATTAVRGKVRGVEEGIEKTRTAIEREGTAQIAGELGQSVAAGEVAPAPRAALGEAIRSRAEAMRAGFKAESNALYDKFFNHPLAREKLTPADEIAGWAERTLKDLPNVIKEVERPTGLVDEFGAPLTRTTRERQYLEKFVPPGVLDKLQQLTSLKGGKVSLNDIKEMRTEVRNRIKEGEALPGVQTHFLSEMESTLTDAINNSEKYVGGELGKLLKKASAHYRENAPKFKAGDIAPLFREEAQLTQPGAVEIVRNAIQNPDTWAAYRKFFGAGSQEFQGLVGAARNDLVRKSFDEFTGQIDAREFVARMRTLVDERPEIAKEVLGTSKFNLRLIAETMKGARGKLDAAELKALLDRGTLTGARLRGMMAEQAQLDDLYRNTLVKQIASGKLDTASFRPSEFVDRLSTHADPKEIAQAMGMLSDNAALAQQVKFKTLESIFNKASVPSTYTSVSEAVSGKGGALDAESLMKVLGDETQQARYRAIIGQDAFDDVVALAKYLKPGTIKQRVFAAAGGLRAGTIVNYLLEADQRYLGAFFRNLILASIYTMRPVRAYFSNELVGPRGAALGVQSFIASTPFAELLLDRATGNAVGAAKALKGGIDAWTRDLFQRAGPEGDLQSVQAQRLERARRLLAEPNPSSQAPP